MRVVTDAEFPHGVRCCACGREILAGQLYQVRKAPPGKYQGIPEGSEIEEITCMSC